MEKGSVAGIVKYKPPKKKKKKKKNKELEQLLSLLVLQENFNSIALVTNECADNFYRVKKPHKRGI